MHEEFKVTASFDTEKWSDVTFAAKKVTWRNTINKGAWQENI